MPFISYREESKKVYGKSRPYMDSATLEEINTGSLQRIADATELMASNYQKLIDERDRYKRWHEAAVQQQEALGRKISALRGAITRMKKKAVNH